MTHSSDASGPSATVPASDATSLLPDEELRRRFAEGGEQSAFRMLVQRHSRMVWLTARRRCESDADADEVAQDVFLVLARKAATLRVPAGLAPWLHRVAVITSAKKAAAQAGRRRREDRFTRESALRAPSHPEGGRPGDFRGHLAELDDALDALSREDRSILIWRHLEGLTVAEVASRLGKTDDAVQKRSERAMTALRRRLSRQALRPASGAVVAALTAAGAAPASISAATLAEWGRDALRTAHCPQSYSLPSRLRRVFNPLPGGKWAMGLAAALILASAVGFGWRALDHDAPTVPAATHSGASHAPPPLVTPADARASERPPTVDGRPPIEEELTAELTRRRIARRALHLSMLTEELGLDAGQAESAAQLYDEHHLLHPHMLGRQGALVLEVITNRDGFGMGSLGPLSAKKPEFEAALQALLSPAQRDAWAVLQMEIRRNAESRRLDHYLAQWHYAAGRNDGSLPAAESYFALVAGDDIAGHTGVRRPVTDGPMKGGEAFHLPPYYEFHEDDARALPEPVLTRFHELAGADVFLSLPETFRAHSRGLPDDTVRSWREHLKSLPPPPEARARRELGDVRSLMVIDAGQAEALTRAFLQRAISEPLDAWPGAVPATDEQFLARRASDTELLRPLLTPAQLEVFRTAPLLFPSIGERFSGSARWDARAE